MAGERRPDVMKDFFRRASETGWPGLVVVVISAVIVIITLVVDSRRG